MKVLLCNKFYYRRGGDCIYLLELEQLLLSHGHEVAVFAMQHPDNLPSAWNSYFPSEVAFRPGPGMIEGLLRPFGTREVRKKFSALLDAFRPEVVHLGNIHSQLSPIIAELAHRRGIRVVWTLHDYKLLCPRYDCLQPSGRICEECFGGAGAIVGHRAPRSLSPRPCLAHRCMKGSLPASIIGWAEMLRWNRERLQRCTDLWICPSRFMQSKMLQAGFDTTKLQHLCNFIDVSKCQSVDYEQREDYYCYVGRLSHEKGIHTLFDAASRLPYRLVVIGGGPLEAELRQRIEQLKQQGSACHIEMVGYQDWEHIRQWVGHARFTVIPSEWYENNPLSVLEAQCLGTPVLGANIGGIPELIHPLTNELDPTGTNGTLFVAGTVGDLQIKINQLWSQKFDYTDIAQSAQRAYGAEQYYNQLIKCYDPDYTPAS